MSLIIKNCPNAISNRIKNLLCIMINFFLKYYENYTFKVIKLLSN